MVILERVRRFLWSRASILFARQITRGEHPTLVNSEVVTRSKVFVCALEKGFAWEQAKTDANVYSKFYSHVELHAFDTVSELLDLIVNRRCDVLHLLCNITMDGRINGALGGRVEGGVLLERLCQADIKLLFLASGNTSENYLTAFADRKLFPLNLVMTLDRKGECFPSYLEDLMSKVSAGEPMPVAWATLVPQTKGAWQQNLPDCIFIPNRPLVKLLP